MVKKELNLKNASIRFETFTIKKSNWAMSSKTERDGILRGLEYNKSK